MKINVFIVLFSTVQNKKVPTEWSGAFAQQWSLASAPHTLFHFQKKKKNIENFEYFKNEEYITPHWTPSIHKMYIMNCIIFLLGNSSNGSQRERNVCILVSPTLVRLPFDHKNRKQNNITTKTTKMPLYVFFSVILALHNNTLVQPSQSLTNTSYWYWNCDGAQHGWITDDDRLVCI